MGIYKDFDMNVENKILEDSNAVKQALKILILTYLGENITDFNFGTRISRMQFEKLNPSIPFEIEDEIKFAVSTYEPRVKLRSIVVRPDGDHLGINIYYDIIALNLSDDLSLRFVMR